jgi:pimeloyl-ACP methyl ester carboxylesterase
MRGVTWVLLGLLLSGAVLPSDRQPGPDGGNTATPLVASTLVLAEAETLQVATGGALRANAPVVVLLTGPVGSTYSMRHLAAALQQDGLAVLVIDPLGMGASAKPRGVDYSLTRQAERIRSALDQLVPPTAGVYLAAPGTSATIALRVAATDTARIRGVVSIAGGPVDKQGTSGIRLALALSPLLDNPVGRALGRRRFASGARDQSSDPSWVTAETVARYLAPVERDVRASFRALKGMYDANERRPIAEVLPSIVAPVRLIVGDKPLPNAPSAAQIALLVQSVRQLRVDTLPHSGTMLHEEQAAAVARIIRETVRR